MSATKIELRRYIPPKENYTNNEKEAVIDSPNKEKYATR
jgi:hypothetical protein